jgi:hypothetical protein
MSNLRAIASDVKCLLGCIAKQCSRTPDIGKECRNVAGNLLPEGGSVRLEDHPLGAFVNRFPQKKQGAADVDVFQVSIVIAADGSGSPD